MYIYMYIYMCVVCVCVCVCVYVCMYKGFLEIRAMKHMIYDYTFMVPRN